MWLGRNSIVYLLYDAFHILEFTMFPDCTEQLLLE